MPLQPFPLIEPAGQLSAGELNRLGHEVEAHDRVEGSGIEVTRDGTGFQLVVRQPVSIWGKITAAGGGPPTPHAWTQQKTDTSGNFTDNTIGLSGTTSVLPAYASDGSSVTINTIVRLFLAPEGDFYLFETPSMGGGAGTLTVREVDLAPTVTMVTTLEFDQADGYVVSTPSAGVARIDHADASATQRGIVSLVAQTMGSGDKTFVSNVFAGGKFDAFGLAVGGALGTVYFVGGSSAVGLSSDNGIDGVFHSAIVGSTFKWRLRGATGPNQALAIFSSEAGDVSATPAFGISPDGGTTVSRGLYDTIATPANNWTITGGIITGKSAGNTLDVNLGGTGATSFTLRGILFGNGTSPVGVTAAGTTGQVVTATTSGDPTWQNLAEANSTTKGIVNLVDQFLGAGNKTVETLVVAGGVSISITGAKAQFDGIAYFGSDIWIKHTQSIVVYNGGVTTSRIFFNTTLSEISFDLADGSDLLRLRLDTFLSNTLCDLTHNGAGVVPQFAVNGTPGITTSDGVGVTTKGGIVTGVTSTASEFLSRNFLGI